MISKRTQRVIIVALAGIALVLLITVLSQRGGTVRKPIKIGITAGDLPPTPGKEAPKSSPLGLESLGQGGQTVVQQTDKNTGRLLREFSYDKIKPLEQSVFDLTNPKARLYQKPSLVIQMSSEEGRFVAPDNQPQSGDFRKNLVVTVFQCESSRNVNLAADSGDRLVNIHLDQATFDTRLGEIRSDSVVDVVTPVTKQVHFRGKGLTMIYNDTQQAKGRIEYLEIAHGQAVRIKMNQPGMKNPLRGKPKQGPAGASGAAAPATAEPAGAAQFYKLTFERNVKVVKEDGTIQANQLTVYFAFDNSQPLPIGSAPFDQPPTPREHLQLMAPLVLGKVVNLLPLILAQAQGLPSASAQVLTEVLPPEARDIVLTWSGKMIMVPVDSKPAELADDRDMFLRFDGTPVAVNRSRQDKIVCSALTYRFSDKTMVALGSAAYPMRIEHPQLGTVAAPQITYQAEKKLVTLPGPGLVRAADPVADKPASPLPPGFRISWNKFLNLSLSGDSGDSQNMSIDSATFTGDVAVDDPRFKLRAQSLAARFTPVKGKKEPVLTALENDGRVSIQFDKGSMSAGRIHLQLAPTAAGKSTPSRLLASGNVLAVNGKQSIQADLLDAVLAERKPDPAAKGDNGRKTKDAPKTPDAKTDNPLDKLESFDIVKVKARGHVVLSEDNRTVRCNEMDADQPASNTAGTVRLIGAPVVISQNRANAADKSPLGEMQVIQLDLDKARRRATADGPGLLIFSQAEKDGPDSRVRVTWQNSMVFDDQIHLIEVDGGIVAEREENPLATSRLTAGHATILLTDPEVERAINKAAAEASGLSIKLGGSYHLSRISARDNVDLRLIQWLNPEHTFALSRLWITGPIMTYRQVDQSAQVIGPGKMLIEDYRPRAAKKPDAAATSQARISGFSGPGASVFTWKTKLTLDGLRADMNMEGAVEMTHKPESASDAVNLQTERLTVDMKDLKANTLHSLRAQDIDHIAAIGAVQLRDAKRIISCDQLYYDGGPQTILLTAQPKRVVNVGYLNQARPIRAASVLWKLATDELEVREVNN